MDANELRKQFEKETGYDNGDTPKEYVDYQIECAQ